MNPSRLRENPCADNEHSPEAKRKPALSRRMAVAASAAAFVTNAIGFPTTSMAAQIVKDPIVQPQATDREAFIQRAYELRQQAIDLGDQAYGAVIVQDMVIIGQSWSRVILDGDPTGHAEMAAIRDAAQRTGHRNLAGAVMYSSSRPCPMCEAAAYWAGINGLIFGRTMSDAGAPVLCR